MTTQIEIVQKFKVGDEVISPYGLMIIVEDGDRRKLYGSDEWEPRYACAFINKKGTAHRRIKPTNFCESELQPATK